MALGLLAMCTVTFAHEALGHAGACLASGGRVILLSSSLFRGTSSSAWVDPAGPLVNLLTGILALLLFRKGRGLPSAWRLYLVWVLSLSFFWEAGYAALAMLQGHGDLFFAGLRWLGTPRGAWRWVALLVGVAGYWAAMRLVSRCLLLLFGEATRARRAARTAWIAATLGAALAALAFRGGGWLDLHDAVLEVGVASLPLLHLPRREPVPAMEPAPPIERNLRLVSLALGVFLLFTLTLGRGLGG